MPDTDSVFAAERAIARRHLWQVPLGLAALLVVFVLLAFVVAVFEAIARQTSGVSGVFLAISFMLYLAFVVITFFALPQAALLLKLGVTNVWARAFTGAISGWMYLFVMFVEVQLMAHAEAERSVMSVSIALWKIAVALPQQIAYFATHEGRGTLLFFALLGAALGAFIWRPMYRLGGKRDWDDPILAGRPPYAR
jgi:hypothetical protein